MDKESLERFNRIEAMIEKSEQRIEKSEQRFKMFQTGMEELKESQEKTDETISKFNGFVTNTGRETEELFIKSIEKNNLKVGQYQFDFLDPNAKRQSNKKGEVEIDLLLLNTNSVGVLEVKSILHRNDVQEHFEKRLPKFKELFPEHRDKKMIGMVAGKVVNAEAVKLAHDHGFVVVTPEGHGLKVDDEYARTIEMDTNISYS